MESTSLANFIMFSGQFDAAALSVDSVLAYYLNKHEFKAKTKHNEQREYEVIFLLTFSPQLASNKNLGIKKKNKFGVNF